MVTGPSKGRPSNLSRNNDSLLEPWQIDRIDPPHLSGVSRGASPNWLHRIVSLHQICEEPSDLTFRFLPEFKATLALFIGLRVCNHLLVLGHRAGGLCGRRSRRNLLGTVLQRGLVHRWLFDLQSHIRLSTIDTHNREMNLVSAEARQMNQLLAHGTRLPGATSRARHTAALHRIKANRRSAPQRLDRRKDLKILDGLPTLHQARNLHKIPRRLGQPEDPKRHSAGLWIIELWKSLSQGFESHPSGNCRVNSHNSLNRRKHAAESL